jgi:thioredoxin reductase (NADPH)
MNDSNMIANGKLYDAIIVGKGPAGIQASIYLARAGLSVLVLGADQGALSRAEKIENYYGFSEPISGAELVERGLSQAKRFGVTVISEEVVNLAIEGVFVARTTQRDAMPSGEYRGRAILLSTGKQRSSLSVPGFDSLRGRGISFCATCDGFFYRNKRLAVVGAGDYAASEFSELLHFTKDITVFTNGIKDISSRFPSGLSVNYSKIVSFDGDGRLSGITVAEKIHTPVDGAFIAIGTAGAADFAAKLGVELSGTDIVVDSSFMTNLPGVFAAGDCIGGFLQVAKAVSDGALAAKGIIAYLKTA